MEESYRHQENSSHRSEGVFISTSYFETGFKTIQIKHGEGKDNDKKLFVSSIKPIHLKRQDQTKLIENTYNLGATPKFPSSEIARIAKTILE